MAAWELWPEQVVLTGSPPKRTTLHSSAGHCLHKTLRLLREMWSFTRRQQHKNVRISLCIFFSVRWPSLPVVGPPAVKTLFMYTDPTMQGLHYFYIHDYLLYIYIESWQQLPSEQPLDSCLRLFALGMKKRKEYRTCTSIPLFGLRFQDCKSFLPSKSCDKKGRASSEVSVESRPALWDFLKSTEWVH